MKEAVVFKGKGTGWRVQIRVFDFTDSCVKKWRSEPVKFFVSVLHSHMHPSTAYSCGAVFKHATLADALHSAARYLGYIPTPPTSWDKYLSALRSGAME